jgi:hypothetical protein
MLVKTRKNDPMPILGEFKKFPMFPRDVDDLFKIYKGLFSGSFQKMRSFIGEADRHSTPSKTAQTCDSSPEKHSWISAGNSARKLLNQVAC